MIKLKCKECSEFIELESAVLNFKGNCYYCNTVLSVPERVAVYYNLEKKTYSIMDHSGERKGLVIGYGDDILLSSVEFKVSEKGRQRVIREKKKNVHAYVIGRFEDPNFAFWIGRLKSIKEAQYNPYRDRTFVTVHDSQPIGKALFCKLSKAKSLRGVTRIQVCTV